MAGSQSAALDRKKLMGDPIMMTTIVLLVTFLTLFILYPLAILLVDSLYGSSGLSFDTFRRIFDMWTFRRAIANTLKVGFVVGLLSTLIGLLFAYVEVYVRVGKLTGGLFKVVSMLPVVSPPFVLSLSMIMLFGRAGLITRFLLGIYDNDIYGYWGIVIVQTLTFFPVCYMMLKGLLKNIDPSMEEAARDMGASRWRVFTTVTLPLLLPGLGNAFLVTFIESIADFANPMIIGGSYDTLATTIYLQITGAMDKEGAAAMAVVLLCITLAMFVFQKYYLERKTAATLTGKASRGRMLIGDRSVTIPLTVLCILAALFVIMMYICVPIGAVPHLGIQIHAADLQVVRAGLYPLPRAAGLPGFLRAVPDRRPRHGPAVHDHLLSGRQAEIPLQGIHRGGFHPGYGGPRNGAGRGLYPRLRQRPFPHRAAELPVRNGADPGHRLYRPVPADRNQIRHLRPAAD